jgi:NADH-quinone oxidoreductase subunit L
MEPNLTAHPLIGWIPLLPLLSAFLVGLIALTPLRSRKGLVTALALGGPGLSLLATAKVVWDFVEKFRAGDPSPLVFYISHWVILAGEVRIDARLLVDPLSAVMISFVAGIGFLIHLYSVGYMGHEEGAGYPRYFSYLNLFMFAMLTLVLGDSLPLLFVGWEGVGLCSYLLIGYYFTKDFAVAAGKKAFVVNRIGDFGFLIGAFLLWNAYGSFDLRHLAAQMLARPEKLGETMSVFGLFTIGVGTAAGIALFLGACGKSAQIPLYVWLPDAMAGPTPVSALIHAATMVTAGVYMVVRMNVLFRLSPTAMMVVAVVGCATALVAATIALVQTDIKKVLAYSTVSQLGFMFLGCGVGAFVWGIFHVFTHAFFKACLFLGSGSVIHGMGGEQDITKMGGLRKKMPITFWTFSIATLAIAGVPPLAGFFSKDAILAGTLGSGHTILFAVGMATALLTAFYMTRLTLKTFWGDFRGTHEQEHHVHESGWTMTLPLVLLAIGSVTAGWISTKFEHFLAPIFPVLPHAAAAAEHGGHGSAHSIAMVLSILVAVIGIGVAWSWYAGAEPGATPARLAASMSGSYRILRNKYFVDEAYDRTVVAGVVRGSWILWKWFDSLVIDGIVNAVAFLVEIFGDLLRFLTTGRVRDYAFLIAAGALALALWTLGV